MSSDNWPQNTLTKMYFFCGTGFTLSDLNHMIKIWFGDKYDEEKIVISSEYIHLYHVNYDLYDSSDYATFITAELVE